MKIYAKTDYMPESCYYLIDVLFAGAVCFSLGVVYAMFILEGGV